VKFQRSPVYGFTTKANGIARELNNEVHLSEFYDPASGVIQPSKKPYSAVWDTGATNTVISRKIVKELNLQPSGRVTVSAVGETFFINISLPNNVEIIGVRVSEGAVGGADVLIGMDIINHGDFAITNCNGQTWWTFRVPPIERIDFVEEISESKRNYLHQQKTKVHKKNKIKMQKTSKKKSKK